MLEAGDRVPDVTLFRNPGDPVALRALAAGGPTLLLFYFFDWSST